MVMILIKAHRFYFNTWDTLKQLQQQLSQIAKNYRFYGPSTLIAYPNNVALKMDDAMR